MSRTEKNLSDMTIRNFWPGTRQLSSKQKSEAALCLQKVMVLRMAHILILYTTVHCILIMSRPL